MKHTHEEVLRRARAEFDFIWDESNREQVEGGKAFNVGEYATQLETMLLNRFGEAGLPRYSCGRGGVAGVEESERNAWPETLPSADDH
jgi:hypothetical protein